MNTANQWYYLVGGGSRGPEPFDQLLRLLDTKKINSSTPVWSEGSADWRPLEAVLAELGGVPPPVPSDHSPPTRAVPISVQPKFSWLADYSDKSPHPWRRYFARVLDTIFFGSIMWFLVNLVIAVLDQDFSKLVISATASDQFKYAFGPILILSATIPNALFIGFTGSSIGKWLFGIKVISESGTPSGFKIALWREIQVAVRGWGLGLPLIAFVTTLVARSSLKTEGAARWDTELHLEVVQRPASRKQLALSICGVALWLAVYVILLALANAA